jgi:hypothetical protein
VGKVVVYNLEVEGTSTYFAEGILVHNKAREEVYLGPELEVDESLRDRFVDWVRRWLFGE